jgi:ATP-dependent exoDNAse (exonuclease V) beta subunit
MNWCASHANHTPAPTDIRMDLSWDILTAQSLLAQTGLAAQQAALAGLLVQTRRDGQWWVLDYKSKAAPQLDADLCAQLLGYRAAIAQATPGQLIRAAFLTPQGALIEINTP